MFIKVLIILQNASFQATNLDMKQGNIAEYNCIFLFKLVFTLVLRCICITNLYLVAVKHDLLSNVLHLTQRSER